MVRKIDDGLYGDTSGWGVDERYALWRLIAHMVDWCGKEGPYRELFLGLEVKRLNREAAVFLKLLLDSVPERWEMLAEEDAEYLRGLEPFDPPISLSDVPGGFPNYREMGVLL